MSTVRSLVGGLAKAVIPMNLRHEHRFANGYLAKKGWHQSAETRHSTDLDGAIPWITYPALAMLKKVVQPHHRVFEYGAGNSSLWWAERVAEIVSVENHSEWADFVAKKAPKNLKVVAQPINAKVDEAHKESLKGFFETYPEKIELWDDEATLWHGLLNQGFTAYAAELMRYPKGHFDIVVVDGMARSLTAWVAAQYVNPKGFILFDNSNRPQYNPGYASLGAAGFKRIDFWGPGPVNYVEGCTSIFAKEFDWLDVDPTLPPDIDCDLNTAMRDKRSSR